MKTTNRSSRLVSSMPSLAALALAALGFGLPLLASAPAAAQVPGLLPIQGTLADADGNAIDGTVSARITLYADAAGTTAVYTTEIPALAVERGFFQTVLGAIDPLDPLDLAATDGLWLGLQVEDDDEMSLIALGSVPFAARAAICDALGVYDESSIANAVSTATAAHDAVTDLQSASEGRAAGVQRTTFGTATDLDSTTFVEIARVTVPGAPGRNAVFNAHLYMEYRSLTQGRYEFGVRQGSCTGTVVGLTVHRPAPTGPGPGTPSFIGDTVNLTAFAAAVTSSTDFVLCGRKASAEIANATVGHRGLVATW